MSNLKHFTLKCYNCDSENITVGESIILINSTHLKSIKFYKCDNCFKYEEETRFLEFRGTICQG